VGRARAEGRQERQEEARGQGCRWRRQRLGGRPPVVKEKVGRDQEQGPALSVAPQIRLGPRPSSSCTHPLLYTLLQSADLGYDLMTSAIFRCVRPHVPSPPPGLVYRPGVCGREQRGEGFSAAVAARERGQGGPSCCERRDLHPPNLIEHLVPSPPARLRSIPPPTFLLEPRKPKSALALCTPTPRQRSRWRPPLSPGQAQPGLRATCGGPALPLAAARPRSPPI